MAYDPDELESEQLADAKTKARRVKEELHMRTEAVKALLQHANGRAYLWWLLDLAKVPGHNAFTGNALTTSFSCGEQNVGQQIMANIIEASPEGFIQMLEERNKSNEPTE